MPPLITAAGVSIIANLCVFGIGPALVVRSALISSQPDWVGITGLVGVAGGLYLKVREADIKKIKAQNAEITAKNADITAQNEKIEAQNAEIRTQNARLKEHDRVQGMAIAKAEREREAFRLRLVESDARFAELSAKLAQTAAQAERADAKAQLTAAEVQETIGSQSGVFAVVPPTGPTVLVVEDLDDSRECMRRNLTRSNFRVEVAGNFQDGLAGLARRPEYAVIDLKIPGGRGEDLMRKVRELGLPTKVIVVTAKFGSELDEAVSMEPLAVFMKSIDFYDELLAALGVPRQPGG